MTKTGSAAAVAGANFALVKYWGKRDDRLNLPAAGSISITVDSLTTRTSVTFKDTKERDSLLMNGKAVSGKMLDKVSGFLNLVRNRAGIRQPASVETVNSFPTGAGLASSASGFAALALAASNAAGLNLSRHELSVLARQGSGSAARSVFGGFVEMNRGSRDDGEDAAATELAAAAHWPLTVTVAVTDLNPKDTGSRDGMALSRETSPFYPNWVAGADADLAECRKAVLNRDFGKLADVSEFNCLKMHGVAMSSRPGLIYWNDTTVRLIHEARRMRNDGIPVFFTVDAGPQVKFISLPEAALTVKTRLDGMPGIKELFSCSLGEGVCEAKGGAG
ncbi:MAG: diphosphomevalonate decarboxylase [Acidobacteria bacterium]|nr:diphosphomevalonate decarboxylase [Acidobacteriota bacterium]